MIQLKTLEGHSLLGTVLPQGVTIALVPDGQVFESGMLDVFSVSMRFATVVRFLGALDHENGFVDDTITARAKRRDGRITLEFPANHDSSRSFETVLDQSVSQEFFNFLEGCIHGREIQLDVPDFVDHGGFFVAGRNDPCPCGSGKKFKKCCGRLKNRSDRLPDALKRYAESNDLIVREYLSLASQEPECLADVAFWQELGAHLGTAGEFDLALEAQAEAIKLDPHNEGAKADHAATLSAAGRSEEAWRVVAQIPNADGRFSAIRGNILAELGRKEEAVAEYERAIAAEPGFVLPYLRLIRILEETRHPLLEYWVGRAFRTNPDSPQIALLYCNWLLAENRLEELADADWTEKLQHKTDLRVIGRQSDGPRCIVAVQALGLIARSIVHEEADQLSKAAQIIASAPADWHLCQVAEQAARAASLFGRRDIVWAASRRFCEGCCSDRLGSVVIQQLLGVAALQSGDAQQSVSDAEIALRTSPDDYRILQFYWYALDEAGRCEDAFVAAKKLHDLGTEMPGLCYHIGFLAAKTGKPAIAQKFYRLQLDIDKSQVWAYENLALLLLAVEQDIEGAAKIVESWINEGGAVNLHEEKLAKFSSLMKYAESRFGEPTYSLDVLDYNQRHEPFFGAETVLPKKPPTREEMVAALTGQDREAADEIVLAHAMETRGDHSITASRLEAQLPGFLKLQGTALRTLIEAEYQLGNSTRADFAPCCMAFCKGLEIVLFRYVFVPFRDWVVNHAEAAVVFQQAKSCEFEKAAGFVKCVTKQAPLELGAMSFSLRLCGGKTADKLKLLGLFREWLLAKGFESLLTQERTEALSELARSYRNPAAHAESFTHKQAREVKDLCLAELRYLLSVLGR